MTSLSYLNPVSAVLGLIDQYRAKIRRALMNGGLPAEQAEAAVSRLRLTAGPGGEPFDRNVWFTLRRPFQPADRSLAQLVTELGLPDVLVTNFHKVQQLHRHQEEAIRAILNRESTVIATGTGSGKTEAFLIPLIQLCLRAKQYNDRSVKAIMIYPMNALAEDQTNRIREYVKGTGLTAAQFVGERDAEKRQERDQLLEAPPDILITNHIMLERILSLPSRRSLRGCGTLQAVVLDEVHTFRGNPGADVAWLLRRLRAEAETDPVFIGASATLRAFDGYLADVDGDDHLRRFLEQLFLPPNGRSVHLILPTFRDEPEEGGDLPEPDWQNLRWADNTKDFAALEAALFGEKASATGREERVAPGGSTQLDWSKLKQKRPGETAAAVTRGLAERLRAHAVIRAWRRLMREQGACTYAELAVKTGEVYQACRGTACPDPGRLTQAVLAGVNAANYLDAEEYRTRQTERRPVLNLVTHLLLRNVSGRLQSCLFCEDSPHHLGRETTCPSCGRPLLETLRTDARWALAQADTVERTLLPLGETPHPKLVVRIARVGTVEERSDQIRVQLIESESLPGGYRFTPSPQGPFLLEGPELTPPAELVATAIETSHNLDYLVELSRQMLRFEGLDPRLLAFGDAREKVAAAGYVLSEDFTHRYLLHLAREASPDQPVPLPDVLGRVERVLDARGTQDGYAADLRREVALWFTRLCATPARRYPEHAGLLRPADEEGLADPAERFLVEVAITEGALAWHEAVPIPTPEERKHFEFDHLARTMRRVLSFTRGARPVDQSVASVSLSKDGAIYGWEIKAYGPEALEQAAARLQRKGIFRRVDGLLTGDAAAYTLRLDAVVLAPASDNEPVLDQLFAVGIHNAETPQAQRRQYEQDFKKDSGKPLSMLVATSTLEMGVDIGGLRQVLCHGVPPNPASYAQRVGRAGRSPDAWFAIATTWCDDGSGHDMFIFNEPDEVRAMVAGHVFPPQMDTENPLVVRRHLFAAVVRDRVESPVELGRIVADPVSALARIPRSLLELFRRCPGLDVEGELGRTLVPGLRRLLPHWQGQPPGGSWFESDMVPDYGFRRDEVALVMEELEERQGDRRESIVSTRPPEQAVLAWFPGRAVATAIGLMQVLEGDPASRSEFRVVADEAPIPHFHRFFVKREEGFRGRRDARPGYRIATVMQGQASPPAGADLGWITWSAVPGATLQIINYGPTFQDPGERGANKPWGLEAECDCFLVQVDAKLLGPQSLASLACTLDHAVQRRFRLNDGELLLVGDVRSPLVKEGFYGLVLADVARRGLVPIERLAEEFRSVLEQARTNFAKCDCENGCFRCLRTYNSSRFAAASTRQSAVELIEAILGITALVPHIPPSPFEEVGDEKRSSTVSIRFQGGRCRWTGPSGEGFLPLQELSAEKTVLYEAFRLASAGVPTGDIILVDTDKRYLIDNARGPKKPQVADRLLMFQALRFHSILPARD